MKFHTRNDECEAEILHCTKKQTVNRFTRETYAIFLSTFEALMHEISLVAS